MIGSSFRTRKPRKFDLPMRYYDEEKDSSVKKHIHIPRRHRKYKTGRSLLRMIVGFLIILIIIWYLSEITV